MTPVLRRLRWARAATLVVCLASLLVIGTPTAAHAHAELISSDPAEGAVLPTVPELIRFVFTEPVTGVPDGVQVFDASGSPVGSTASVSDDQLRVALDPPQGREGTLVVVWRVISQDGHPVSGSLSFSIGSASPDVVRPPVTATPTVEAPPELTAARWVGYTTLLAAAGLVFFAAALLPRIRLADAARSRLVKVARLLALITVVAWLIGLPLTAAYQLGGGIETMLDTDAWATLTVTEYAVSAAVVVGIVAAVSLVTVGRPAGARRAGALATAAVAVAAPALTGHTRAATPEALVVGADMLHLVAGAVWLGGLLALVLVLPGLARLGDPTAGETLARFSGVAATVLAALVVTGSVQAWRIVGSWGGLTDTGYGQLLLAKIFVALLAVAFAAWNRYRLLPRLQGTATPRDRPLAARLVTRTTFWEAAVLVAVLSLTAVLVDRSPEAGATTSSGQASRPGTQVGMLGAYQVTAEVAPLATGSNTVTIETRDFAGEPFEGLEAPKLRFSSGEVDLGEVPVASIAPGAYSATVVLPTPGTWRLQVSLRIAEFDNPVAAFDYVVPED